MFFLVAGGCFAADDRALVEAAVRRVWDKPILLLALGLRQPPPKDQAIMAKALQFTAKSFRLDSLEWKPSATAPAKGPVTGDLRLAFSGRVPPSGTTLDCTVHFINAGLDRAALEKRGALEIVSPGRYRTTFAIPFDLLALISKGTTFTAQNGKLEVKGKGKFLFFTPSYRLIGRLESPDRVHVNLEPDALSLASLPAPGPVRKAIVDTVNPVFCSDSAMGLLRNLAILEVDRVSVEPAGLAFEGSGRLRLPGDPEPGPPHHPPRGKGDREPRR